MNILTFFPLHDFQDFRNYRYSLPMVPGLMVDLEAQRTCIKIPITGYNEAKQKPFFSVVHKVKASISSSFSLLSFVSLFFFLAHESFK